MKSLNVEEQQDSYSDNIFIPLEIVPSIFEFLPFAHQLPARLTNRAFNSAFYKADKITIKTELKQAYQEDYDVNSNNEVLFARWLANKQEQNYALSLRPFFKLNPITYKHQAGALNQETFIKFKASFNTLNALFGEKLVQAISSLPIKDKAPHLLKLYQTTIIDIETDIDAITKHLPEAHLTAPAQKRKPYRLDLSSISHFIAKITPLQKHSSTPQQAIDSTLLETLLSDLLTLKNLVKTVIDCCKEGKKPVPLYLQNFHTILITFYRQIDALESNKGCSYLDELLEEPTAINPLRR